MGAIEPSAHGSSEALVRSRFAADSAGAAQGGSSSFGTVMAEAARVREARDEADAAARRAKRTRTLAEVVVLVTLIAVLASRLVR